LIGLGESESLLVSDSLITNSSGSKALVVSEVSDVKVIGTSAYFDT